MKNTIFIFSLFVALLCAAQNDVLPAAVQNTKVMQLKDVPKYTLVCFAGQQKKETHTVLTYHRSGDWVVFSCEKNGKSYAMELHWSAISSLRDSTGKLIEF